MQSRGLSVAMEIWEESRGLDPVALSHLVEEACAGDPAIQREVTSLLAHRLEGDSFLETPAVLRFEDEGAGSSAEAWLGQRLGAYELVELIGRGGSGAVFRALRRDGEFEQEVAVKVLHRGWVGTHYEDRFRRERQILAGLDHPHLARLLDGGVAPGGVTFVVMELVRGQPLTTFCRERRLPLRPRLELFRKVCEVVQYAHNHLVVHRDLKPENILVTEEGVPKLLDFGIAKLLDEGPKEGDPTVTSQRALTVGYASPEQVLGGRITTASDVFSLGVILFQLLTGKRPFDWSGRPLLEVERSLERETPDPPSRHPPAEGLSRRDLNEDLDRIAAKALDENPSTALSVRRFSG